MTQFQIIACRVRYVRGEIRHRTEKNSTL